jgi:hypothetical protein
MNRTQNILLSIIAVLLTAAVIELGVIAVRVERASDAAEDARQYISEQRAESEAERRMENYRNTEPARLNTDGDFFDANR